MTMSLSLRDRISKKLQARSLSSRYGDFTFDSSPRRRRRNDRYSSVCISSAESTPLFNAPAPSQGQVPLDAKTQPASWNSAIDPLATASLMLATVELDRLTNRQVSDRGSEVLGSGQSSTCGGPPSSPAPRSMNPGGKPPLRLNTNSYASERSIIPRKPLPPGFTMRSGNSVPQATPHSSCRQRKTSSRFSDIRTPENILEASDEDVSSTTCTNGGSFTPPSLKPGGQPPCSSLVSPTGVVEYSCTERSGPALGDIPVNRIIEQIHLTQSDPSKGVWASRCSQSERTPQRDDKMSPKTSGKTQDRKSPTQHLQTGALTPHNTGGLWCPPRKSASPSRPQSMRNPDTPTGHSNE